MGWGSYHSPSRSPGNGGGHALSAGANQGRATTPRFTKNNKQNNYYTHTYSVYSAVIYCDISILELCYCIFFYFYLDIDVLFLFMSYFLIHVVHCELVEPDGI